MLNHLYPATLACVLVFHKFVSPTHSWAGSSIVHVSMSFTSQHRPSVCLCLSDCLSVCPAALQDRSVETLHFLRGSRHQGRTASFWCECNCCVFSLCLCLSCKRGGITSHYVSWLCLHLFFFQSFCILWHSYYTGKAHIPVKVSVPLKQRQGLWVFLSSYSQ